MISVRLVSCIVVVILSHCPTLVGEPKTTKISPTLYPGVSLVKLDKSTPEEEIHSAVYSTGDDFSKVVSWYKDKLNFPQKTIHMIGNCFRIGILHSDSVTRSGPTEKLSPRTVQLLTIMEIDEDEKVLYLFVISRASDEKATHIQVSRLPLPNRLIR